MPRLAARFMAERPTLLQIGPEEAAWPSMRRARSVWLVVFPGSDLLDVGGPWEVLSHANDVLGWRAYALQLVSPLEAVVPSRHGLLLAGARPLRSAFAAGAPDLAMVAGGNPVPPLPPAEARFAGWARRHHTRVARWVSICTGAFVLGEAGLLDGRRVTTHFRWTQALRERFPRAIVVDDALFERSGAVWTSAGITAGIDLTLALVEEHHGHEAASLVAKNLLLFLRRSGRQAQFSESLRQQASEPAELNGLTSFVLEHLHESLPVARIARGLGTSVRSLTRACREKLGESPAAFVRRQRVEHARQLLEQTSLPLPTIARRAGLGNASTLHRAFSRAFQLTPAEYRARFA